MGWFDSVLNPVEDYLGLGGGSGGGAADIGSGSDFGGLDPSALAGLGGGSTNPQQSSGGFPWGSLLAGLGLGGISAIPRFYGLNQQAHQLGFNNQLASSYLNLAQQQFGLNQQTLAQSAQKAMLAAAVQKKAILAQAYELAAQNRLQGGTETATNFLNAGNQLAAPLLKG